MRMEILCPVCKAGGLARRLQLVEDSAAGRIYPYCKACKRNVPIFLDGKGRYWQDGAPFRFQKAT